MSDLATTVGTFELPDCAPPYSFALELSNAERSDRIIMSDVEGYMGTTISFVDFYLQDDQCNALPEEVHDYWEQDLEDIAFQVLEDAHGL
jgi:hypothetical protein